MLIYLMNCRVSLDMKCGSVQIRGGPPAESGYGLYINDEQWTAYDPNKPTDLKNLLPSFNMAHGDCVLSGFGFGFLPNMLAKKPSVKSIKVYEINSEVIELNREIQNIDPRIEIINDSIHNYEGHTADCVLLDHYEFMPDHLVIEEVRSIAKKNTQNIVWWWNAEKHIMNAIITKYHKRTNLNPDKMYKYYLEWREEANIPNLPLYNQETLITYLQLCDVYSSELGR